MLKLMLVMLTLGGPKEEYDKEQRYNDSLLIYKTYCTQVKMLKSLKWGDEQLWYTREVSDDSLTACAKIRLKRYNNKTYTPSATYERQEIGTAYAFPAPTAPHSPKGEIPGAIQTHNDHSSPKPTVVKHETQTPVAQTTVAQAGVPGNRLIVYDKQTYFMITDKIGKIIPYIKRLIFDKGRLLYTEKLNPVTLEKLMVQEGKIEEKEVVLK